eukprot:3261050-Pleurochrysis_carterae.AAC.2
MGSVVSGQKRSPSCTCDSRISWLVHVRCASHCVCLARGSQLCVRGGRALISRACMGQDKTRRVQGDAARAALGCASVYKPLASSALYVRNAQFVSRACAGRTLACSAGGPFARRRARGRAAPAATRRARARRSRRQPCARGHTLHRCTEKALLKGAH